MAYKSKLSCKYGKNCYRKSEYHLSMYFHDKIEEHELQLEPSPKKIKADQFEISKEIDGKNKKILKLPIHINKENLLEAFKCSTEDKKFVENVMQMPIPEQFFEFWNFCVSIDKFNPLGALSIFNLELIGAFRLLIPTFDRTRKLEIIKKNFLTKDRYFYDPPQFSPLFRYNDPSNKESKFHFGYYRDDPAELPIFLTSNDSNINGKHLECGHDIISSIKSHINKTFPEKNDSIIKLLDIMPPSSLKNTAKLKKRNKSVVSIPLNGIGLVVKIDAKTKIGYRELPETNGKIKKMISEIEKAASLSNNCKLDESFDPLMEIVTLTQFANDELDYGMGLELGLDLFCSSNNQCLSKLIGNLLPLAFDLSEQPLFVEISKEHLESRYK